MLLCGYDVKGRSSAAGGIIQIKHFNKYNNDKCYICWCCPLTRRGCSRLFTCKENKIIKIFFFLHERIQRGAENMQLIKERINIRQCNVFFVFSLMCPRCCRVKQGNNHLIWSSVTMLQRATLAVTTREKPRLPALLWNPENLQSYTTAFSLHRSAAQRSADHRSEISWSQISDQRSTDQRSTDRRSADHQIRDQQISRSEIIDQQIRDQRSIDQQIRRSEINRSEINRSQISSSEINRSADQRSEIRDQQIRDQQISRSEINRSEINRSADQRSTDQRSADQQINRSADQRSEISSSESNRLLRY